MLVLLIIYILSCIRMYFWVKNSHSTGGWLEDVKPNGWDFLGTFIPAVNTLLSVILSVITLTGKKSFDDYNFFMKFFNIKK